MSLAICTLFEKDYHYGVAGLANSLFRNGFVGRLYAGYRGALPRWAEQVQPLNEPEWPDAQRLAVESGCEVVFLPMNTRAHFTNVKPDFMLRLFSVQPFGIDTLYYLDPDICLVDNWQFLSDWSTCGVALCEDINSPIEQDHPRRVGWRRHFAAYGVNLRFRSAAYVNGGCVGIARDYCDFLLNWRLLGQHMAEVIGGLSASSLEGGEAFASLGFAGCFDKSDQDVLNAAIEMTEDVPFSILPRTAMGFSPGKAVLPHALGAGKPWRRRYLYEALGRANPPTTADKAFWQIIDGPLRAMPMGRILRTRLTLRFASAIGRLYRRN
jgi:hypothetical protein